MIKLNIRNIVSTLLLSTLIVGCSDFLDVKPKGKDLVEKIEHFDGLFNNPELTEFRYTMGKLMTTPSFMFMSDEFTVSQATYGTMSGLNLRYYQWSGDFFTETTRCVEWNGPYSHIYIYNVVADGVMDALNGTKEQKVKLLAEARVRRAYNYWLTAQFFSKPYDPATATTELAIPLLLNPSVGDTKYKLETIATIYDFVLKELKESCELVEERVLHRYRLNRAAAYFILGKVHFSMKNYQEALNAFNRSNELLAESEMKVQLYNYNTQMALWKWSAEKPWAWTANYPETNMPTNEEQFFVHSLSVSNISNFRNNPNVFIKDSYMNQFSAGDLRRNFFAKKNYTGAVSWDSYRRINQTTFSMAGSLPELYLMLAECEARVGSETNARNYLFELRRNRIVEAEAAIPTSVSSKNDLIRFCVEESQREFMGSGMRWFDVRRLWSDPLFQHLKANYTHTDGEGNLFRLTEERLKVPIPLSITEWHPEWKL